MRRSVPALLAAALLMAVARAALAQAPGVITYQGSLTDAAGAIVPDGNYTLTLRLYDVPSGGSALWTEVEPSVAVSRGFFSVVLGQFTGLNLPFDKQYYLGVAVSPDPEMLPRVMLTSTPSALSLRLPWTQNVSSGSPLIDLTNSGAGADAHFEEKLDVGGPSPGNIRVLTGASLTAAQFSALPGGAGFLSLLGASKSATFDLSATGNATVQLPNDAVVSAEIGDEPGVAGNNANGAVTLPNGQFADMLTRTLTAPAAGYALVLATLQCDVTHVNGTLDACDFGVSTVSATQPSTQDYPIELPATAPSGTYRFTVTVHGLFPVTAGASTFYLVGHRTSGTVGYNDLQLSAVYFPTSYGTVAPAAPAGAAIGPGRPLTAADVAAERAESIGTDRARLDREMSDMRARLAALETRLAQMNGGR